MQRARKEKGREAPEGTPRPAWSRRSAIPGGLRYQVICLLIANPFWLIVISGACLEM